MTSTVSFADRIVRPCDLVKAQSCFTLVTVVSSILSSFVGGVLFEALGTTPTLGVSAILAIIGLVISLFSISRIVERAGDR
jgi:predicted MFS family arabinose efflux permease